MGLSASLGHWAAPRIAASRGQAPRGRASRPAAHGLTARVVPGPGGLDAADGERWNCLVARAAEPNPFFEPWYLRPSLDILAPGDSARLLVVERAGDWLGLMPVAAQPRYYGRLLPHWRNWLHANAFLGTPLIAQGHEAEVWRAMLDWADRFAGRELFLHLAGLPLDGPVHTALTKVCAADGRRLGLVHREDRAMLSSGLTPEAYLEAALSGKKRKELRRQYARLCEQGAVSVLRQRDAAGIDEWLAAFLALELAGWKGLAGSALACAPQTTQLFTTALREAAELGRLERLTLALDGVPIAMLATFLAGEGAFSYKTAFDERFARFSPGVLLQRENLALLEDPGLAWCDSCAAADHPMIDHLWRERRAIGRVSVAIGGTLRRAAFRVFLTAELTRSGAARARARVAAPVGEPE